MKKIILALVISSCSLLSFASSDVNKSPKDSIIKETNAPQDRIAKLEAEVKELKAINAEIQKQLAEIKNQLPAKKKKMEVNRVGSKQPVWVEE